MSRSLSRLMTVCILAAAGTLQAVELPQLVEENARPNRTARSPELEHVRQKLNHAFDLYRQQPYHADSVSPWSVLHAAIGFGADAQLQVRHADGNSASAIGWLCYNHPCRGQRLFYMAQGEMYLPIAPGLQGHEGQFLSMLAQSRVPRDYELRIGEMTRTVADLVQYEQRTCRRGTELTFKLIGLSHYVPSDAQWKNDQGEDWSVARLISEELQQPIVQGACCGGTHRLMGLSYAVNRRVKRNEPVDGPWQQAQHRVAAYQERALAWQNADGSFSMNWFVGPGDWNDPERKLETSGHTLEWLAFSMSTEQLQHESMQRAVLHVADVLSRYPEHSWNAGAQGHALHALRLYRERVFDEPLTVASSP